MLRNSRALRPLKSIVTRQQHRTFVSTVLLTKAWENVSFADLRKEAKIRGLSAKGNKSTLITRIQEHEDRMTLDAIASRDPPVPGARSASSAATSVTPGIPPAARPAVSPSKDFTNIYLPDVSQPEPEPPIQIPFSPDFWESSNRTQQAEIATPGLPKILVVGGSATHHGGGPSHNLHTDHEAEAHASEDVDTPPAQDRGFWHDVADHLRLPASLKSGDARRLQKAPVDSLPETLVSPGTAERTHSRPLDEDEVRGVWVLLGLFAGSWLAGGYFNRKPVLPAEEDRHHSPP